MLWHSAQACPYWLYYLLLLWCLKALANTAVRETLQEVGSPKLKMAMQTLKISMCICFISGQLNGDT